MPLYPFTCPACATRKDDFREVESRNDPLTCECGAQMDRDWSNMGSGRPMMQEFNKPIEMYSVAVNTPEEIRDFQRRNPEAEISTNRSDPLYGVPIARTRQQKMSILEREGFMEMN